VIYAADIRDVWDIIVDGLREVAQKTDAEWRPEDIYHSVLSGKSFLFMDSSDPQSFVVLSEYAHPYLSSRVLVVDIAYNKTGDAIDRYQAEMEEIAKEAGAKYLEFSSPRAGFKRVADRHGYEAVCTTYRKTLNG
jgi:hypothetical protein